MLFGHSAGREYEEMVSLVADEDHASGIKITVEPGLHTPDLNMTAS